MTAINPARTAMVTIGNVYAKHASQFNYSETSTRAEIWDLTHEQMLARLNAGESITGDCSSTYEATRKFAGCIKLPPLGYTGSELETMPHITLAEAEQGDAIVFGPGTGLHVVWITSPHPTNPKINGGHLDPKIDSHGMPGFQETDLTSMWGSVFSGQPITVLSLAPFLPEVPMPKPIKPSGTAHFSGTLDLATGKGTVKGEPGVKVVFGTDASERSLTITVKDGGKGAGAWTVKP
jgi:hypothetical protein